MGNISHEYLSEKDFNDYCDFIIDGLTTRQASEKIGKNRSNVLKWLNLHATAEQRGQYARACEWSADAFADDGLEAALDSGLDIGFKQDGEGGAVPFVDKENIQRSRLKWDALRWHAGKRNPKKYGDKQTIAGDAENPVKHDHKIELVHVKPSI